MKYVEILVCIVAVSLLLGCVAEQPPAKPSTTVKPPATIKKPPRKVTTTTLRPDIAEFKKAKNSSNMATCDNIENIRLKDVCIRDIAMESNNLRACGRITTASVKDTCYYRIAISRKDSGICDQIANEKMKSLCKSKAV